MSLDRADVPVPVPRPGVRVLAPAMLAVTATVLPAFLTGALAVQLRDDLDFGAGALGIAIAAFFGAGAVTSTWLGWTAERLGSGRAMRLAVCVSGAGMLAIAVGARSWGWLVGFLVIAGIGNSIAQPAANLYLARAVDPSRQGMAFGVKQSAIPAATLLGGLAVPGLALTVGWRWAYAGGAALALLAALAVPDDTAVARLSGRRREGDVPMVPMIVLSAGVGLGAAAAGSLGGFLVDSATAAGVANGTAGLLAAAGSAIGLATRLRSGVMADRRGGGHLRIVWQLLAFGTLTYLLLAVGTPAAFFVAAPVAYATAWGWPALFHLAIVRRNPAAPGAATGITQTGTYVGAVVGPLGFGALVEGTSYGTAWVAAGVCSLAAAVTIAAGRRMLLDAIGAVDVG